MNTTFINIAKNTSDCSFTTSKWDDNVAFISKVRKQLEGDMEV